MRIIFGKQWWTILHKTLKRKKKFLLRKKKMVSRSTKGVEANVDIYLFICFFFTCLFIYSIYTTDLCYRLAAWNRGEKDRLEDVPEVISGVLVLGWIGGCYNRAVTVQVLVFERWLSTGSGSGQEYCSVAYQLLPWAKHLISLYLSVPICRVGKVVSLTQKGCYKNKGWMS